MLSEGWKTWPKNLEHKPKIDVQVKNRWKYMKSHEINSRIADAVLQLQSDIDPTLPSTVSEQLSSQASDYLGPSGSNA